MKVAVSILKLFTTEEETIAKINETDAEYLHIDVTDGSFVPGSTPTREFLHMSKKPLNVHLMVSRPFDYVVMYKELGAESITIQCEIEDDLRDILEYIKNIGMKCGMALKPETPVSRLKEYFDLLDEVLILSVHPGVGGQKIIESTLDKIPELISIRENEGYKFDIFVDGGITDETIKLAKGADAVVAGTFICNSEDYQAQIDKLRL